MGAKCFKDSDTPWVDLKCNCIAIHNSENARVGFTDGDEKGELEEEKAVNQEKPAKEPKWLQRKINERRAKKVLEAWQKSKKIRSR